MLGYYLKILMVELKEKNCDVHPRREGLRRSQGLVAIGHATGGGHEIKNRLVIIAGGVVSISRRPRDIARAALVEEVQWKKINPERHASSSKYPLCPRLLSAQPS